MHVFKQSQIQVDTLSFEHKNRMAHQNIKDSQENMQQLLSQKEANIRENHDRLRQTFKNRMEKSDTDLRNMQEINKRVVIAQSSLKQIKAQVFQDKEDADKLLTTMLSQEGSDQLNGSRIAAQLA